jgi:hypothetical protein
MTKYSYVKGRLHQRQFQKFPRTKGDDYEEDYSDFRSMDVMIPEYAEEDYFEETGVLDSNGNPILRHFVRPPPQRAGFILLRDDDDE